MIVNLRGTHGSGKSTIIGQLLEKHNAKPLYGVLGIRKPEAYKLTIKGLKEPAFILGPYTNKCGGCDAIQPYDLILELIERYAAKGHVIFEGALVSSSYGRVGRLMETFEKRAVMAFLATPLETCIKHVKGRREERGDRRPLDPHNTVSKYKQIVNSKRSILKDGKMRVVDLEPNDGATTIVKLLKEDDK